MQKEPILHEIFSVTASNEEAVYIASIDLTDTNGERYTAEYCSRADDTFGLAPIVRAALEQWIADGKPVSQE